MKKLVFLVLAAITIASCDTGSNETTTFAIGPVQDVTMASTYKVDSISEIMIRYKRPSDAHMFVGFYYQAVDLNRIVAIEYARLDRNNPGEDTEVYEVPLKFRPSSPGTYVFKFWDGVNQDGTDHFYVAEAVVNN